MKPGFPSSIVIFLLLGGGIAGGISPGASSALWAAEVGFRGVFNGSFDQDRNGDGVPDGWTTAGRRGVVQKLTQWTDPQRGKVARLVCTQFEGGFPDSHAMIAQTNQVAVQRGQWYQVRLWAKAEKLESGVVEISVVNCRQWQSLGLEESFTPTEEWQSFTIVFQATQNLQAEDGRLQIWFTGTGILYLDDVEIEALKGFRPQRQPLLACAQGPNIVPNSSFECGGMGWGCYALDVPSWGGALFDRLGTWDATQAYHGQHSWRLVLRRDQTPVSFFDYFDPSAEALQCVVLAHEGWIPAEVGQKYAFSAYVRADEERLPGLLFIRCADGPGLQQPFTSGSKWTKVEYTFTVQRPFFWAGIGVDLRRTDHPGGTLWIDAVQIQHLPDPQAKPADYQPRQTLETALETEKPGNIFPDPAAGLAFRIRAYNAGNPPASGRGRLSITDYQDQVCWQQNVELSVPPGQSVQKEFAGILAGQQGFFRIRWTPAHEAEQTLRCAVIQPYPSNQDSAFGMNHALSWDFLLRLSHQTGLVWWRDWSCQWRLVQPQQGAPFDFSPTDPQVDRVLRAEGRVLLLLPFPTAPWATEADLEKIRSHAHGNDYLFRRLVAAQKPRRMEDFAAYVRASLAHWKGRVHTIEILNEPIYTTYALPQSFGYNTSDYIEMLRTAYQAAKQVDPQCLVVGGIGAPPGHRCVQEFIEQDGLRWCDAMNYHLYPHRGLPDFYEKAFQDCWQRVQARGQAKPIWITEFGCYGDDDPAVLPFRAGDATMTRSQRPNELRASADLVKFAAIMGSAGVQKIFYHAGTCSDWNESSAGNIFFEYGGTPRKMYAAQAALARLLGPKWTFVRKWSEPQDIQAFQFRSADKQIVILWAQTQQKTIPVPDGYSAFDLMGNRLPNRNLTIGWIPVYLVQE